MLSWTGPNFDMTTIDDIIAHQEAYKKRLYLVPSENSPSIAARLAFLTDLLNRYYFSLQEHRHWAFPGNEFIEKIYERCKSLLREATGAKFINIRPISGVNAMTIALASLVKIGETVASIAPENGGHAITAAISKRLGLCSVYLPYNQDIFAVNIEALPEFINREGVSLIYLDQAQILFPHKLREMRERIPETTKIYYDGSHVMGLIFGNNFQNPLKEGADFLGGSTHKTIPGPHKGFIATNDAKWQEWINGYSKVFVSHDHGGDIAALTIVLEEMHDRWPQYAKQVVMNAKHLAQKLDEKGFVVIAKHLGFTQSHQLWIDTHPNIDAFEAVLALARCNIIANTIRAPSLTDRLAVRLGVQEVTYCGANEQTMDKIADLFEEILLKKSVSEEEIRKRVADLKSGLLPPIDKNYLEKIMRTIAA